MPQSTPSAWLATLALLTTLGQFALADTATSDAPDVAEAAAAAAEPKQLTIGDKAPSLDIENWVQTGEGKFEPVKDFAADKVYVVEFWATWCPPCVASMPHLSQLQQDYADRGVTVVSVSDEPLETVNAFLEREVQGKTNEQGEPVTFNDITKSYCLTSDPDESTSIDYMRAAGQNGIPCAFLVGKDGRIEWIGHPMSIDDPLEKVVSDSWDREAFAVAFKAEQEFEAAFRRVMMMVRAGNTGEAMTAIDDLIANAATPELAARAQQAKTSVEFSIYQMLLRTDQAAATEKLTKLVEMVDGNPRAVNSITWMVVQQGNRGEVSEGLVAAATGAIDPIIESGEADASLIDTYAHLVYLQGDLDRAIELAESASAQANGRMKVGIDAFLKELKAEKAGPAEEGAEEEDEGSDE